MPERRMREEESEFQERQAGGHGHEQGMKQQLRRACAEGLQLPVVLEELDDLVDMLEAHGAVAGIERIEADGIVRIAGLNNDHAVAQIDSAPLFVPRQLLQ